MPSPTYALVPLGESAAIIEAIALIIAQDYRRAAWIFHCETDARARTYESRYGPLPPIPDDFAPAAAAPEGTLSNTVTIDCEPDQAPPSPVSPGGPNPR